MGSVVISLSLLNNSWPAHGMTESPKVVFFRWGGLIYLIMVAFKDYSHVNCGYELDFNRSSYKLRVLTFLCWEVGEFLSQKYS